MPSVKRTRCPNGTRKNPKTGKCESKKSVKRNNNRNNRNNKPKSSKKVAFKRVSKTSTKPSAKQRAHAKLMRNELMELSGPYQAHKKEQIAKKALAKKIKANNLKRARNNLKPCN